MCSRNIIGVPSCMGNLLGETPEVACRSLNVNKPEHRARDVSRLDHYTMPEHGILHGVRRVLNPVSDSYSEEVVGRVK